MHVHTVFSTDGSRYQRWQSDLLAYSFEKVGQPGPLTRLYSASNRPSRFDGRTFQTPPFSPHPVTNDAYPPYNRIGALSAWLAQSPPKEQTLLVLDPDFIFLTPYDEPAERGRPAAQPINYMDPAIPRNAKVLKRHGFNAGSVQAMGIPLVIHPDDLKALLPVWMEKTEAIRADRLSRRHAHWIAEMLGYVFAAAQLGLRHEMRDLARWSSSPSADLPFIHYCHDPEVGRWRWTKYKYRPWKRVPEPPRQAYPTTVALISLLNELAKKKRHRILRR